MTLYSEIWGEIEKPGTMMGTQAFIGDDHPGTTDLTPFQIHFDSLPCLDCLLEISPSPPFAELSKTLKFLIFFFKFLSLPQHSKHRFGFNLHSYDFNDVKLLPGEKRNESKILPSLVA